MDETERKEHDHARGEDCGEEKRERERERVEWGPVWLTDDLIKRGTNYRPAGC